MKNESDPDPDPLVRGTDPDPHQKKCHGSPTVDDRWIECGWEWEY
jgi:hypothetical protein